MPFNQKPQKFNAKINTVTVGTGDKAVTIGGNSTFPFYTFDAPTENEDCGIWLEICQFRIYLKIPFEICL